MDSYGIISYHFPISYVAGTILVWLLPGGRQRLAGPPGPLRPFDCRHAAGCAGHSSDAASVAGAICGCQQEAWVHDSL